jgi:hypothetical protein
MKYIITESKLENVVIKYLNKMYGDLEEYIKDDYPNKVFYIKGKKVYMEHNFHKLWIDYYTIWLDLADTFSLENDEIRHIITKWVEATYNLRGFTPIAVNYG